ncbi:hypothetical protein GCM10023085_51820 [Actinomadura viridis]|uniref:Uncharacterized protein n=1 Tax=Actinomadura viridis TaxID=58110 RepID=A0A931GMQ9_9ACTN|nr:hypothetical protein [Actinomadura viridis]MBG6092240.1 hypothetical protein [Actinomadura viridis]
MNGAVPVAGARHDPAGSALAAGDAVETAFAGAVAAVGVVPGTAAHITVTIATSATSPARARPAGAARLPEGAAGTGPE